MTIITTIPTTQPATIPATLEEESSLLVCLLLLDGFTADVADVEEVVMLVDEFTITKTQMKIQKL